MIPRPAAAQVAATARIRGTVQSRAGSPLAGVNVFLLETLEGAITTADGRFVIATRQRDSLTRDRVTRDRVTLVARRLGFQEFRRVLTPGVQQGAITIVLEPLAINLAPTVVAGRYTAGEQRGATLTALEVVTTPGTAADVARTIQTLPGVQGGDEGNALFVRGGDYLETKVFLNDAALLTPAQTRSPVGTFVGSVDPFLLDGIFFSSGGFGARYGDALSAVVSLRTLGAPRNSSATITGGLGTLSAYGALALPHGIGIRAASNVFNLRPLFQLNRPPRDFEPAPLGRDVSASAIWHYRESGELKVFGIDQSNRFALGSEPSVFSDSYGFDRRSRLATSTWHDVYGHFSPSISASYYSISRGEEFPGASQDLRFLARQLFGEIAWSRWEPLTVRAGGEVDRRATSLNDHAPLRPGVDTSFALIDASGVRTGAFGELDVRATARLRLITGVRTDFSTLSNVRTVDPRVSAAFALRPGATLTAAWGIYHQLADPLQFDSLFGIPFLPPMRARQAVLGGQIGSESGGEMARVEVYDKRYQDLVSDAEYGEGLYAGGTGSSRGVDVFVKGSGPFGTTGRISYSYVHARRTYPGTTRTARAKFDIPHTVSAVVERAWRTGWRTGVAYRYATGRPFSRVAGARFDPGENEWTAEMGRPMNARLPDWRRLDLSASYLRRLSPEWQAVGFVSLINVLDRRNVTDFRYANDYSRGAFAPSIFNRQLYVGASLTRM